MKHSIIFFFFLLILNCNTDPSSGFKIQIKSSDDKILIDGLVINLNGTKLISSSAEDNINNWHDLSISLANTFYKKGAQAILNEIDNENS